MHTCTIGFECAPYWPVKKAIVNLPINLKGNSKRTSGHSLSPKGAQIPLLLRRRILTGLNFFCDTGYIRILLTKKFLFRQRVNTAPDVKMKQCWGQTFSKSLHGELRRSVEIVEWRANNSKMAAVVNDEATSLCFHTWQHSLDQSQGTKEVHVKQFLGHVDWDTLQHGRQC